MNIIKKIKKYAYIAVFIACVPSFVSANSTVTVNPSGKTVTVSGKSENDKVKIIITDSSALPEELDNGTASFAVSGVYADETTVKFGSYKFADIEIDESRPFGDYSVRIINGGDYEEITFPYASENQIADIIASDSTENLMWCIDGFAEELQTDTDVYNGFDEEGKKEFLTDYMLGKGYTPENFGENFKNNISVYLEKRTTDSVLAITNAKTAADVEKCIKKYNDIYKLDFADEEWLGAVKNDALTNIYARLAAEKFETAENINSKCKEKIALYFIEQGPWGSEEQLLDKYAELLSLDLDGLKALSSSKRDDVYKKIKGTYAENGAKLQEIIDTAVSGTKKTQSTSGGGSGGSSGSANHNGGFLATVTDTAETNNKKDDTADDTENIFFDIKNAEWAEKEIRDLYEKGIVNGYDGKFMPNENVTRAELVKMLKQSFGLNAAKTNNYDDVDENHWAYPYVSAASDIVLGYGNGIFGVDDYVTREDTAVFIYRTINIVGKNITSGETVLFDDSGDIADYAKEAVSALAAVGIINGTGDNKFSPKSYATRAETAVIIYRALQLPN